MFWLSFCTMALAFLNQAGQQVVKHTNQGMRLVSSPVAIQAVYPMAACTRVPAHKPADRQASVSIVCQSRSVLLACLLGW